MAPKLTHREGNSISSTHAFMAIDRDLQGKPESAVGYECMRYSIKDFDFPVLYTKHRRSHRMVYATMHGMVIT